MPIRSSAGPLLTLDDVIAEVAKIGAAGLELRYGAPVLIVQAPTAASGEPGLVPTTVGESGLPRSPATTTYTPVVIAVASRPDTSNPGKLTLGSAGACDIQIPFPSVSKVHAFLLPLRGIEKWEIADAGSTNGTLVDGIGHKLGAPVELRDGAELQFGNVTATFWLAATFRENLKRRAGLST